MKNFILSIIIILALSSCTTPKYYVPEMPYKNYRSDFSPFLPLNLIESDTVYRFSFYESKSLDKIVILYKDEKNDYKSYLIEFGKVFNKKKEKEIFNIQEVTPKDGYINFLNIISKLSKESREKTFADLANHEPILNYVFEAKSNNELKNFIITISKSELGDKSIKELEIIDFIKSQFNIN